MALRNVRYGLSSMRGVINDSQKSCPLSVVKSGTHLREDPQISVFLIHITGQRCDLRAGLRSENLKCGKAEAEF